MANRITSFPPIISETSKVLILGSAPGVKSLQMQQYYAHTQNQFWKILFHLFEEEFQIDYDARKQLLAKYDIALWDVIDSCEREGSSDAKIRKEEHNDVLQLISDYPNIKAVFSNGQKIVERSSENTWKGFANSLRGFGFYKSASYHRF